MENTYKELNDALDSALLDGFTPLQMAHLLARAYERIEADPFKLEQLTDALQDEVSKLNESHE